MRTLESQSEPALEFDDETHTYRIGKEILPSVTHILTSMGFLSIEWVTPEALYRGRYVHQAIHYLNEGDYDLADCLPEFRGYVESWVKFRDWFGGRLKIIAAEKRMYDPFYKYAGTMDLWCKIEGWEWVIDYKTVAKGSHAPEAAKFQTGAYELLLGDEKTFAHCKRACLELREDGSMGNLVPHDDLDDGQHFLCILDTYNQRRLYGITRS